MKEKLSKKSSKQKKKPKLSSLKTNLDLKTKSSKLFSSKL